MSKSIVLAFDVAATPARVYEILTTTQGQRAFWTADCDVHGDHARFGFPGEATVDASPPSPDASSACMPPPASPTGAT